MMLQYRMVVAKSETIAPFPIELPLTPRYNRDSLFSGDYTVYEDPFDIP